MRWPFADVTLDKGELRSDTRGDFLYVCPLSGRIVVVVEVVDTNDPIAPRCERLYGVAPDEAGSAGY